MTKDDIQTFIANLNNYLNIPANLNSFLKKSTVSCNMDVGDNRKTLNIEFVLNNGIKAEYYQDYLETIKAFENENKELYFNFNFTVDQKYWTTEIINDAIIDLYLFYKTKNPFVSAINQINERSYEVVFANAEMKQAFDEQLDWLIERLDKIGFFQITLTTSLDINVISRNLNKEREENAKIFNNKTSNVVKEKEPELSLEECKELNQISENAELTEIAEFDPEEVTSLTTMWGKIYSYDYKVNGANRTLRIGIADKNSATSIFSWVSRSQHLSSDYLSSFKKGDWIKIQLRIKTGREQRKFTEILKIQHVDIPEWLKPSPDDFTDRHEFFFHTKMSVHDGLNDVDDLKAFCEQNQIKDIAITDTGVVQAFPELANWKEKGNPDIKVHYGLEVDVFDDEDFIVKNNKKLPFDDVVFVVYDIETTGLNAYYEQMIEIGAVRIQVKLNKINNKLEFTKLDEFEKFIKNKKPLSEFTTSLTGIKESDLKDAKDEKTVLNEFIDFIQPDDILVAHNGIDFDFIWLNTKIDQYQLKTINNPMLDTLRLAYQLYQSKSYTLQKLATKLGINYDEEAAHRANYDTDVLSKCLMKMLSEVNAKEWTSFLDLNDKQKLVNAQGEKFTKPLKSSIKIEENNNSSDDKKDMLNENLFNRIRTRKALVYAKNKAGLKKLYKLVSLSSTDQFYGTPKLFWSDIQKYSDDLLVSSHPLLGHVIHAAKYDTNDNLRKIIKKHDFVLVPLPSLFKKQVSRNDISLSDVQDLIKRIIDICEQEKIPYTFSSAAHYLRKEQKQFYECLISAEVTGKKIHHFYDRDMKANQQIPDLHIRRKQEVYNDFSFIKEPEILANLIHKNGAKISSMFKDDGLLPYPKDLHPPKIEGSDDKLTELVKNRAYELFGDNIDPIIQDRIDYELKAIVGNGYGIVYWLAHLLVKKSNDDGYIVGSRGSVGSSIVALLAGISEVNPLQPYYYCKLCKTTEFIDDIDDGHDLINKPCINKKCDGEMNGEGHNIPFASFMGFNGEKTPDIDLNFSSQYQATAHNYVKELFGESHTTRCGTISTMQDKTAYKIARDYLELTNSIEQAEKLSGWYASEISEIKRTTGQHPGGILVFPKDKEIEDFCPVNYPADDKKSKWRTSHFKFEYLHDTLLKLDILSQEDPTILRKLYQITGVKPEEIPNNDKDVLSLFNLEHGLDFGKNEILRNATGALGIPEFGTKTTREILKIAKPQSVADLIRVSGLSHGTDVWTGNAADLILYKNYRLDEVIACRDDIMTYLSGIGIEKKTAFSIMEDVRKGKKLKPEYEKVMREFEVSNDYIDSCNKIKYMFPKAHATAYVLMAWKIAWFKLHHPMAFYAAIYSYKVKEHDVLTCINGGIEAVTKRYKEIKTLITKAKNSKEKVALKKKDEDLFSTYELYIEMLERGIKLEQVSLQHSEAAEFTVKNNKIYPPFNSIDGLGDEIAKLIVKNRDENGGFKSQADLKDRCKLDKNVWNYFVTYKVFGDLKADEKIRLY
ncbi:PolC-type DNA polymerase III [Mycoplasma sp. E35C]|uniref:PolC-type DNA polymerase III n=1 Tax=Mycoplasma sp. E35C TaxID=2801918 RepID=UPI001CA43ED7|nr:PolC-type DNA polymerase III [Mycoplasma sp. E35C]QZX49227.1 PolC-type DNA polymerase III [Mycoplasma sp. E35C]